MDLHTLVKCVLSQMLSQNQAGPGGSCLQSQQGIEWTKRQTWVLAQPGLQCESQSSQGYSASAESFFSKDLRKKRRRERGKEKGEGGRDGQRDGGRDREKNGGKEEGEKGSMEEIKEDREMQILILQNALMIFGRKGMSS